MALSYQLAACPVCGTRAASVLADVDGIRRELEALWLHHARRLAPPRPLSALADRISFTQPPPLAVVRCRGCGMVYRNPRERFVRELYEREPLELAQLERLRAAQLGAFADPVARLTRLNGGVGRGLEIGSYTGAFLAAAERAGWHFDGVDVSPVAVAFLHGHGHPVVLGDIGDVAAHAAYDVVAIWNCFDQLDAPAAAARAAHERLRRGGILAIRVPNGGYYAALRPHLDGPLSRVAGALLARHNLLTFPYRHGFTRPSLRRLLRAAGFGIVREHGVSVLPAGEPESRALRALERALRPLTDAPWLECYARRE